MPGKREQEIIAAYEAWDPDEEGIGALVERLSISRQRLYDVLDRNSVIPKSKRGPERSSAGMESGLLAEMAEMALGYLLGQLQAARSELKEYRDKYGPIN